MELQALFRFFDQYLPLDEGEKATFRQRANIRRIKRRQFLLQEGALCRYYWFVVEACLKRLPPIHATGATVPEENRECFVLQLENGSWKIARYLFNKMQ